MPSIICRTASVAAAAATTFTAAVMCTIIAAGPAAASPPPPEGPGTPTRRVVVPVPVPYHDPDAETLHLFVAATVGALLAGLVRRRPRPGPQPRSDEPPRVIELTVARS
ncbi:hypothetical protein Dvina_22600 [Dactylosporangium vinaceum]|uniref:Uncharacterized protein n=1 Tax=Dactylosporangium vinaceum TaxID=53362 RepID=A0ABV5M773_9ACTN|nr:hypothetical protein [Dactylosporangium vinaceum]UAC00593.1 hypothetical protein Dvina_22600 [Dactylosporangium vinaceum]